MTVEELGERMSSREYARWMAREQLLAEDKGRAVKAGAKPMIPLTPSDIA